MPKIRMVFGNAYKIVDVNANFPSNLRIECSGEARGLLDVLYRLYCFLSSLFSLSLWFYLVLLILHLFISLVSVFYSSLAAPRKKNELNFLFLFHCLSFSLHKIVEMASDNEWNWRIFFVLPNPNQDYSQRLLTKSTQESDKQNLYVNECVCGLYSISFFFAAKMNWARKICINTQINAKPAQHIGKMRRKAFKIEFKQIHLNKTTHIQ